jgi:hypothetical protein
MAIRTVKQHTDRGSLKNLVKSNEISKPEAIPLPSELRMKQLYEFAQLNKDKNMQSALGFITTDYISDKNAIPLSVYRIRQIVEDIKSTSGDKINNLAAQFLGYMSDELSSDAINYLNKRDALTKTASVRRPPSFWRVSRK